MPQLDPTTAAMRLQAGHAGVELSLVRLEPSELGEPTWLRFRVRVWNGADVYGSELIIALPDAVGLVAFLQGVAANPATRARYVGELEPAPLLWARGGTEDKVWLRWSLGGAGPGWAHGREDGWWWVDLEVPPKALSDAAATLSLELPNWP